MRDKSNAEPIITKMLNQIHGRLPLIGVGSIYTADDAIKALDTGVEFLSLGREIIMEPDWMTKVEMGKSSEIRTNLKKSDRELLKNTRTTLEYDYEYTRLVQNCRII